MGLFDFLKRGRGGSVVAPVEVQDGSGILCAPVGGTVVQLFETSDPVFSSLMMGAGVAFEPDGETVYAPVGGTVSAAMPHAVGITSADGVEALVHVGVETVGMGSEVFTLRVKQGDTVAAGQPLITFSKKRIADAGRSDTVFLVVTNTDAFASVTPVENGPIRAGQAAVTLTR